MVATTLWLLASGKNSAMSKASESSHRNAKFVLVTFLRMYKERVQGNEAERDRGQDPAALSGYLPPARPGMPGWRPTGTEQLKHHGERGPRDEAPPPTARSDMAWYPVTTWNSGQSSQSSWQPAATNAWAPGQSSQASWQPSPVEAFQEKMSKRKDTR